MVSIDPMMGVALSLGDGEVLTHHHAFSDNTLAERGKNTSVMLAEDRSPGSPCGLRVGASILLGRDDCLVSPPGLL